MKPIYDSDYIKVELDEQLGVVFARRTSTPFPDSGVIRQAAPALFAALPDPEVRAKLALLLDMRAPSLRNDPEFENAIQTYLIPATKGFRKIATLVRTNVGVLQATRVSRKLASARQVFLDEAEAVAFLTRPD